MIYRLSAVNQPGKGRTFEICEGQINEWGLGAFLRESQHEVAGAEVFFEVQNQHYQTQDLPELRSLARAWDLAGTEGGGYFTAGPLLGTNQPEKIEEFICWIWSMGNGKPTRCAIKIKTSAMRDQGITGARSLPGYPKTQVKLEVSERGRSKGTGEGFTWLHVQFRAGRHSERRTVGMYPTAAILWLKPVEQTRDRELRRFRDESQ